MIPEIIYCADGNARFAQIAIDAGFTYGAQVPNTVYFKPQFTDQNWKEPNLGEYAEAVAEHRPRLATVLDWERWSQLGTIIHWGETIAPYTQEAIIIIPKVRFAHSGWQNYIPRSIGGIPVRLGYSVPTSFGSTPVQLNDFLEWPLHLLGGSPISQAKLAGLNSNIRLVDAPKLNIVSVDCNYHHLMATRYNQFFVHDGSARYAKNRWWPALRESNAGKKWGDGSSNADAPYEAFRRSCESIMDMWHKGSK